MFETLKSIRRSLLESFRDGVLWRESVSLRNDQDLEDAANASVNRRFLPINQNEDDDPIIIALHRIVTPETARTIHNAVIELQNARETISDHEASRASLEDVVAAQRVEINNLAVRLETSQKDIQNLHKTISNQQGVHADTSYDIAVKALRNSRMREAELRSLASGVIDSFNGSNHKPITALDHTALEVLREAITKEAQDTYEGIGSYAISEDHSKWEKVANAIIETISISGISIPEHADPEVLPKMTNAIFQAFCVHYGLDPNPTMYEMGKMPIGQIENYDRLRNASRIAANAILGKHLDEHVRPWTKEAGDLDHSVFAELETKKSLTTPPDGV